MKRNFKKIALAACGILTAFALAACGGSAKEESTNAASQEMDSSAEGGSMESEGTENGEKVVIGYVINNLNDTFQTYILEAAQKYGSENGIEVTVVDSQEDTIKQQDHVHALIEKGVSGLIVIPTDTSAMQPITEAAQEANIPLVFVNRNPYAGMEDTIPENVFYVGSDEKSGGEMQMEYIGEQIGGEGGVAVLMGILGNEGAMKRTEGVEEIIAQKYPNVKVLTKETGNWQRDQGLSLTENFITTYGDELKAVISNNDEMALGAIQALQNNNMIDKVAVAGLDAIPDALAAVKEGTLTCTIFQDANGQGGTAVKIIQETLQGNTPAERVQYIPFKLVTQENVDEFTK